MTIASLEPVRADWKVSEVLRRYPDLLEVLIQQSPHFKHLRNPLARGLRTRLVSVSQAARIAGLDPSSLVRTLNTALGLDTADIPAPLSISQTEPGQPDLPMALAVIDLDIRPALTAGEEPFPAIMQAVADLPEGAGLRLRTTFEPIPLYDVLARRGFSHASRELGPADWTVTFTRGDAGELSASAARPPTAASVSAEEVIHLDVSDLAPPEPMVRILETAAQLTPGQILRVEHHRRPVYLYPQLDAQGFVHETREIEPGRVEILIRRGTESPA
ncbi:MAG: DUF2249 domain-containing protein [Chloroflexota bacterium]